MKEYIKFSLFLALSTMYGYVCPMMQISASITKNALISQIDKITPLLQQPSPVAIEIIKLTSIKKLDQLTDEISHFEKQAILTTWSSLVSSHGMFHPNQILYSSQENPNTENRAKKENNFSITGVIIGGV